MKKQKLLFVPFLLSMGIGLLSCNFDNGGNVSIYPSTLAVVEYDMTMGGTVICTPYGIFASPSLTTTYYPGDCIFIQQFTIDIDNQPSTQYYTASDIYVLESINQSYLVTSNKVEIGDYTLPLSDADGITSVFYKGKFFVGANSTDKKPDYRLIYNSAEEETNGIKNLYLLAKPSSNTSASITTSIHAFDLLHLIHSYGRDTTITVPGALESTNFRYIKANLNYLSEISGVGEPVYKKVPNPFEIYIFR